MTTPPIDVQIINHGDQPAFAVLPYSEYLTLMQSTQKVDPAIPQRLLDCVCGSASACSRRGEFIAA